MAHSSHRQHKGCRLCSRTRTAATVGPPASLGLSCVRSVGSGVSAGGPRGRLTPAHAAIGEVGSLDIPCLF